MDYIRFIGHAAFEISISGLNILIDPFFGAGLKQPCKIPLLKPALIRKADLILLTHEHIPHADPAAVEEIAKRTGASIVASAQTLKNMDVSDRQKVDVRIGDSFSLKGLDISVVKAIHPQSEYPIGFLLKDYVTIYHAGDTYQFNEMNQIDVDYALIPIGGSYTMDPIDAANSTKLLRAKFIIPMHYNTYSKIEQDSADFARRVTRGKVVRLDPDQSIKLK